MQLLLLLVEGLPWQRLLLVSSSPPSYIVSLAHSVLNRIHCKAFSSLVYFPLVFEFSAKTSGRKLLEITLTSLLTLCDRTHCSNQQGVIYIRMLNVALMRFISFSSAEEKKEEKKEESEESDEDMGFGLFD